MDVLRRRPKCRDRIKPRNRPRDRFHLGHPSWYHILLDTCRGNENPGSETPGQARVDRKGRGTRLDGLSESRQAMSAADRVEELVKDLRLSKRLSDYGIKKDDLPSIAKEAAGPEEYSMALEVLQAIF